MAPGNLQGCAVASTILFPFKLCLSNAPYPIAIGYGAFDKHNLKGNNIVLATAHPCKFPGAIQSAINVKAELPNELTFVLDQKENYDIVENDIEKVKQHIKDRT